METAVLIPIWKRPEITRACLENLSKTGMKLICGVSNDEDELLATEFSEHVIRIPNKPLGRKKNILLEYALEFEWEQIMESNSDNIYDLEKLNKYLHIGQDHYGVNGIYFAHPSKGQAKFFRAKGTKIWGAGRVMSRKAVTDCFPLWDDEVNIYLDSNANKSLARKGYDWSVVGGTPFICDVKSEVNIHPYSRFSGHPINYKLLQNRFPELKNL